MVDQIEQQFVCPLCSSGNIQKFFSAYYKCRDCTFVFVSKPDLASYEDDYYFFDKKMEKINALRARFQVDFLMRSISVQDKKIKLLDIGCGSGHFLKEAIDRGFDAFGVDISQLAIKRAVDIYGLKGKVFHINSINDIKGLCEIEGFNVITLWEIIEHLPSPKSSLNEIARFLKPGGYVFFSTPNIGSLYVNILKQNWHGFGIFKYHLSYFNPKTLSFVFPNNQGFKKVAIKTISPYGDPFFITKNLIHSLIPQIKNVILRRIVKAPLVLLAIIPNKILEFFACRLNRGDTLIGYAIRK
jgi:2-polyprenyl-3-methyl-5-hydroxy-6-metoxy-1,4-benzoquinol methylase